MRHDPPSSALRPRLAGPRRQALLVLLLAVQLVLAACIGSTGAPSPAASVRSPPPPPPPESYRLTPVDPAEPPTLPEDPDALLPVDPALIIGRLDNGLTYYVRENEKPVNRADIWLAVDVGSILEEDDERGFAHFIEHMAFNGSENFEPKELVAYLESIGMSFGPDINAYTGFDQTVYMLRLPTDDEEILDTGFTILEDWADGVLFDPEEVERERGVVMEEWRLGRGVGARLNEQQMPVLLGGSLYAERLPIGEPETLTQATPEGLRAFYERWYRPELMAVIAIGDFDAGEIEREIVERFRDLENPEDPVPRPDHRIPAHEETRVGVATDPEATQTIVSVFYKLPKAPEGTGADYRRMLVKRLYDAMFNARLAEIAQRPDPPFLFASAGGSDFVRTADVYTQVAAVGEGEVLEGLAALVTEAERVDVHGFTPGELERAKAELERLMEQALREGDKRDSSSYADEYTRHFFEGEPTPGIAMERQLVDRFLPTITLEEVNTLASRWISEDGRVVLVSGPEEEGVALPTEAALLDALGGVETARIEPWEDKTVDAPLVAEVPEPAAVTERERIEELGVERLRFDNGVTVWMKPTDFQNDQVLLTGWSPGGLSLVPEGDLASGRLATAVVSEGGLGVFGAAELEKALAGKAVSASTYIGELEEGVSGGASPEDLETMLQLVYLQFTEPRRDEASYRSLVTRLEALLANRDKSPGTAFSDALNKALTQDHPRRRPLTPEVLEGADLDRALEIYRDRFADASDFQFVLVGNFEPAEVEPLLARYLGALPAIDREESWRDVGVEAPEGVERVEVERGLEEQARVSLVYHGEAEFSREEDYLLDSMAELVGLSLRETLREDLGGTYGVEVRSSLSARPREEYQLVISFAADPARLDELLDVTFEEIDRLRSEPPSTGTVAKIQEQQRRTRETRLRENGFWLSALETYATWGWDPRLILERDELISTLTAERLREAVERYLPEDRYVLGVLEPEAGPETAEAEAGAGVDASGGR